MGAKSIKKLISLVLITIIAMGGFGFASVSKAADFNKQMNYQGKLTDSSNAAVDDGLYNMEFSLYADTTGGVAIWTESCTSTDRIQVTSGLFS